METYKISLKKLKQAYAPMLIGKNTLELCLGGHTDFDSPPIEFPNYFLATLSFVDETNDSSNLKYYRIGEDVPFLVMGFADAGFSSVMALMRVIGKKVE
jgi:hypothetical protein